MTQIQQMVSVRRRGRDEREEKGRGVKLNEVPLRCIGNRPGGGGLCM